MIDNFFQFTIILIEILKIKKNRTQLKLYLIMLL